MCADEHIEARIKITLIRKDGKKVRIYLRLTDTQPVQVVNHSRKHTSRDSIA